MVVLIDALERKGYAKRKRAANRREYRIELATAGEEKAVAILDGIDDRTSRVFSPLSAEDLKVFRQLARAVIGGSA